MADKSIDTENFQVVSSLFFLYSPKLHVAKFKDLNLMLHPFRFSLLAEPLLIWVLAENRVSFEWKI